MDHLHSRTHLPAASFDLDHEPTILAKPPPAPVAVGGRSTRRKDSMQHAHPRPPLTPNTTLPSSLPQSIPNPLLPSAPASPPTPAPSPTPHQRAPTWCTPPDEIEDPILRDARLVFSQLSIAAKEAWLASIVDSCDNHILSFLHHLVSPRLKKDPFRTLPNELCFKVHREFYGKVGKTRADLAMGRFSNLLTIPKPLFEHRQCRGGGGRL